MKTKDTIIVGDTLFDYFVGSLSTGKSLRQALKFSNQKTTEFLLNKNGLGKVLFLACTHGDEDFSIKVLKKLEKNYPKEKYLYDWVVANPVAVKKGERFVDSDLNRAAPGKKNTKLYEEKRAYELIQLSKKYDAMLDLHSTVADCGIVTMISDPTPENITLAKIVGVKRNVIWISTNKNKGSVTQYAKCPAVGIECGPKRNNREIQNQLYTALEKYLQRRRDNVPTKSRGQQFFEVYGKERGKHDRKFKDFVLIKEGNEKFYPFLTQQYKGTSCYKLKKLSYKNEFISVFR